MSITRQPAPNDDCKRLLLETRISEEGPGAILHDMEVLLRFIDVTGIEAGGQQPVLPMRVLPNLNALMHEPLRIKLQRAHLRSYPNLQGLFLLARASGLLAVQTADDGAAMLALDSAMLGQWQSLNPTERYFSLLDVWMVYAREDTVGERSGWQSMFSQIHGIWGRVGQGRRYSRKQRAQAEIHYDLDVSRFRLALMWLFGFLEIDQGDALPGKGWWPASVRPTPFGTAMMTLLASGLRPDLERDESWPNALSLLEDRPTAFDQLKALFNLCFPEWRRSLTLLPHSFQDGVFVFKATLRKIWRTIKVPAAATWYDLATAIRKSVSFDDDHLWGFTYTDRFGRFVEIVHPAACTDDDTISADELEIGSLQLRVGGSMRFAYDFGDQWEFDVTLLRIEEPDPTLKRPKLVEKHGKSPAQYPDWDE